MNLEVRKTIIYSGLELLRKLRISQNLPKFLENLKNQQKCQTHQ